MKRNISVLFLAFVIITETIILYNQNKEIIIKNNTVIEELENNNLIINDKINLENIKEEKNILEEQTQTVFKNDDIETVFNTQKEITESLTEELTILENKIINLESNLNNLQKEYNRLYKEYEENNTFYITNVPLINQYPDFPTGCESIALTILLNYYGVMVTPDDIISSLPKGTMPYTKNGITYGGNPEIEFVGNPYSMNSYGMYEKPLAEAANKFKPGIKIATGTSFDEILEVVKQGKPVIVWTAMYLASPYISTSWIYEPTGETIYWKANEHAVVLIGYTPNKVIISDPIGGQVKYQSLSIFRDRYNYYGKKALYY